MNGERRRCPGLQLRRSGLAHRVAARATADGEVDLTFEVEEPSSPLELGWSSDERRIGILLREATLLPADDDAAQSGLARERRLARWAARGDAEKRRLQVGVGEAVELDELNDYGAFGDGWVVYPQEAGIWTEGSRSELALALDGIGESDYVLALSLGSVCVEADGSLRVEALVNGERVASPRFQLRRSGSGVSSCPRLCRPRWISRS